MIQETERNIHTYKKELTFTRQCPIMIKRKYKMTSPTAFAQASHFLPDPKTK